MSDTPIQRYEVEEVYRGMDCYSVMRKNPDGDYVMHDDHVAKLTAANARIAEMESTKAFILSESNEAQRKIQSLTRQLSDSQAQLAKRAENVSPEEANELRDVLRTLVPSGRAFITSARELVQRWEEQKTEIQTLSAQLADMTDAWDKIFDSRRINGMSHTEAAKALIVRNEKLQEENELLNQLVRGGSCLSCAELKAQLASAREAIKSVIDSAVEPDKAKFASMVPLEPLRAVLSGHLSGRIERHARKQSTGVIMIPKCQIIVGDNRETLKTLPDNSVHCVVTSPPYFGLRDYGHPGQIGQETTPAAFIAQLMEVFREVSRVLRDDGTIWVNMGDTYAAGGLGLGSGKQRTNHGSCNGSHIEKPRKAPEGFKPKDLLGIPWRLAFALQDAGWYLRSDIIWHKPNPMPESVTDRPTKAHEYLFLLTKSERYFYDAEAIAEAATGRDPGNVSHKYASAYDRSDTEEHRTKANLASIGARETRNKRTVWTVPTAPYSGAHFATFPPDLIRPCIRAGCPMGGTVLDPFGGSGTTGQVANEEGRDAILLELNPAYAELSRVRTNVTAGLGL